MSDDRPPPRRRIAGEPAPAKKAAAKKPVAAAKKAPAKKAAAKKTPAAKTPATKAPSTRPSTAKAAATTTTARKTPAKKTPAKKTPAKKAPAKKAAAKKAATPETTPTPAAPAATEAEVVETARPQVARPAARTRSTASADEPRRRDTRTLVLAAVAAVVLVAGVVVAGLGFQSWRGESAGEARSEAVSVASRATETIFSFSYDKLDEHSTESKSFMTPSYAKEFDTIAPALTDIAPQRKVSVEAVTRNAAVLPCGDECSPDRASVLVFVDQDRRIVGEESSTVFGNRIEVDLRKTDGDWKVNDIRAL